MALTITDMLGSDPFSASRFTINANFQAVKTAVDSIESQLGISTAAGNIDVSAGTGGQITAKTFSGLTAILKDSLNATTISLTGATGIIVCRTLSAGTSIATASGTIETLAVGASGGAATFGGITTFNDVANLADGWSRSIIDLGAVTTHAVDNSDNVLIFDSTTSLTLSVGVGLVNGHVITLVRKSASGTNTLLPTALIAGAPTVTFTATNYKSSITLVYSTALGKWVIANSNNVTIA